MIIKWYIFSAFINTLFSGKHDLINASQCHVKWYIVRIVLKSLYVVFNFFAYLIQSEMYLSKYENDIQIREIWSFSTCVTMTRMGEKIIFKIWMIISPQGWGGWVSTNVSANSNNTWKYHVRQRGCPLTHSARTLPSIANPLKGWNW